MDAVGEDTPVYVISVAAELSGLHPQTLRTYDRLGLVRPKRTSGRGRRYCARDIATLREIRRLTQEEGINLAGIKYIFALEREAELLRGEAGRLRSLVERLGNELEATRAVAARLARLRRASEAGDARPPAQGRRAEVVLARRRLTD
ncbi:heat shock protein transcriptional repressor HspR [Spirillospora sp. CA-255316]